MLAKALASLAVLLVVAVLTVSQLRTRWEQPMVIGEGGYQLTVASGETLNTVARRLQSDGVYAYPILLRAYGRWTGLDQQIKHGEYLVPVDTTPESLLLLLHSGKVIHYQVTLPEGITLARAIALLAQQPQLQRGLTGPDDERLLALVKPHQTGEGLFFPDSYRFERGTSDLDILQRANAAMMRVLTQEWGQREEGLPYENVYEVLIMASIVERETGLAEEREEIAGVFIRRLQKGMRLQTDPTIIYGLGEQFDGNLRRRHLLDENNPYNTYRHSGLPPSPIALPGRAAIHAALHPAMGSSLYFVARGDGGHQFSATLAEHERAVRKYQLKRRENYRSSPETQ